METPRSNRLSGKHKKSRLKSSTTSTPKSTKRTSGKNDPVPETRPESPILPYPFSQVNPTGVYWNYDGSPASKARLEALLNQSDDEDDPPTPDENVTPAFKLKFRPSKPDNQRPPPPKIDMELLEDLEDLRAMWARIQAKKGAPSAGEGPVVSTPPQAPKPPRHSSRTADKTDLFADDSADNSFLIQCTQAAETEHFKQPPSKIGENASKAAAAAAVAEFEQDEEFDFMLSQMPMDSPKAATPKASASTAASWRRAHSSPEAATTSASLAGSRMKQRHQTESSVAGFNKAEAERRRREAIERRESKKRAAATITSTAAAASKPSVETEPSQKPPATRAWSKEENDRKRQEALRKRQQSQARKAVGKRK